MSTAGLHTYSSYLDFFDDNDYDDDQDDGSNTCQKYWVAISADNGSKSCGIGK